MQELMGEEGIYQPRMSFLFIFYQLNRHKVILVTILTTFFDFNKLDTTSSGLPLVLLALSLNCLV